MIARQTYREYADEILEGRELATENTIESLTEQGASTPVKTDEFHMSRTNLQFQDESETIDVDDITDNKTDKTVEIETKQTDIEENTTFKLTNETKRLSNIPEVPATPLSQHQRSESKKPQASKPFKLVSDEYINFVLGDSNALRLHIKDLDVVNLSKSGQTAPEIDSLLAHAREKAGKKVVKRIVMHLRTNDVSRCRTDSNQVTLEVSSAVNKVHTTFPKTNIAFSSILQ